MEDQDNKEAQYHRCEITLNLGINASTVVKKTIINVERNSVNN